MRCGLGVSTLAGAVCAAGLIAFAPQIVMRVVQSRQYLNTIGCNRAMFTFA